MKNRLHKTLLGLALGLMLLTTASVALAEEFRPKLQVPIPGVSFSSLQVQKSGTGANSSYVDIPWIAQYVNGIYRFGLSIAGVVAAVTMVIGGWQYMTGNPAGGKERIKNSLIGVVLVFGAYIILNTINPELVTFAPIRVNVVDRILFEVPESQMVAITGKSTPSSSEMINKAMAAAAAKNIPGLPCFVKGSMEHESGGKQNAIGHDENVKRTVTPIGSRQKFLQEGRTFLGKTFTPIDCHDRNCQSQGGTNDDVLDPNKPDLGLDWRFSHGIGAGQTTIFNKERGGKPCPGRETEGNGIVKGGKCYTSRDLLDPDKSIEAMIEHYASVFKKAKGDPAMGYVYYGGNIDPTNEVIVKRVKAYEECLKGGT